MSVKLVCDLNYFYLFEKVAKENLYLLGNKCTTLSVTTSFESSRLSSQSFDFKQAVKSSRYFASEGKVLLQCFTNDRPLYSEGHALFYVFAGLRCLHVCSLFDDR